MSDTRTLIPCNLCSLLRHPGQLNGLRICQDCSAPGRAADRAMLQERVRCTCDACTFTGDVFPTIHRADLARMPNPKLVR